jgi:hypothetical protein
MNNKEKIINEVTAWLLVVAIALLLVISIICL